MPNEDIEAQRAAIARDVERRRRDLEFDVQTTNNRALGSLDRAEDTKSDLLEAVEETRSRAFAPKPIETAQPDQDNRIMDMEEFSISIPGSGEFDLGSFDQPVELFDADIRAFGWSLVDDSGTLKAKITGGYVEHHEPDGSTQYYYAADATNIALTTNRWNVIYVNYTIKSSAAISTTVSASTSENGAINGIDDTTTILRVPIVCFHKDASDKITLVRTYRYGNIQIFPLFAA